MNRSALKTYAPKARREFIQAVTDRAAFYGLTKDQTLPVTVKGDVAIIGGRAFPRSVAEKRAKLEALIGWHGAAGASGFEQTMEAIAYAWFNRLVAIRYMELHGYLDHGYRVLSHPEGKTTPEIVEHAEHVSLRGLDSQRVIELKLDGTKESELFRMLLLAQCNALHSAMPFLFERIDDETELLLPENLLHSDSIVRKLVSEIDEADWQEVEIIGWLYQFYISEKKDEVIGKVVKSEDIPAATQLFTPNWIVKYLVQNSLGRQWLATYPDSTLKSKWEYYIEPAEQTPEVQAKLKEITPTTLNPENLTIMDPACGSGHILVEAYDLLKDIYLERGYRLRDIPRFILTKNVYGLEIDDRAAQLACFALLMKARADDRKIFDPPPQLNVLAIQETNGLDIPTIVQAFTDKRITKDDDLPVGEFGFMVAERAPLFAGEAKATPTKADEQVAAELKVLLALFENAKTYGSLITIPSKLAERLPKIAEAVQAAEADSNLAMQNAARIAGGFVMAANMLAKRYDAVVANPPYMGRRYHNALVRTYLGLQYDQVSADLFSAFVFRMEKFATDSGGIAGVSPNTWLYIASHSELRKQVLTEMTLENLVELDLTGFSEATVQLCAFTIRRQRCPRFNGVFLRLVGIRGASENQQEARRVIASRTSRLFVASPDDFQQIPDTPISYWASPATRASFRAGPSVSDLAAVRVGMHTGSNARFVRAWYEVRLDDIGFDCQAESDTARRPERWYPYNKGGDFRKWFGNATFVVNWKSRGEDIHAFHGIPLTHNGAPVRAKPLQFQPSVTWSFVSSSYFGVRQSSAGFMFDVGGSSLFPNTPEHLPAFTAFLCSTVAAHLMRVINPTLNFQVGNVASLPFLLSGEALHRAIGLALAAVELAREDWNSQETSWGFSGHGTLQDRKSTIVESLGHFSDGCRDRIARMIQLEEENNALMASAYGLAGELPATVQEDSITLYRCDTGTESASLISYAVGCAMGRYTLDTPGLIYANSGNEGFDPNQYKTFPADPDGIIPITEHDWFPDSAARRFEEFVGVAWPKEHLEENLQFVADSLTGKSESDPRETIRSYFANDFYKHHLQTYKKRPIYWLFCSGKHRAFQALVYLHRYQEGTLARMRTEYVIPLQGKIASRINQLEGDISKATSSAHAKKLTKEKDALEKQRVELLAFDEKLRHCADQCIKLDLDDGVKVNYGKFGDLLAEVKAICGEREEE